MEPEANPITNRIFDEAIDILSERIDILERNLTDIRQKQLRYRALIDRSHALWDELDDEQSRLIQAKEVLMKDNPARL